MVKDCKDIHHHCDDCQNCDHDMVLDRGIPIAVPVCFYERTEFMTNKAKHCPEYEPKGYED